MDRFVAEQRDWMVRVAQRLCHSRAEAEDIVHAAVRSALEHADHLRPDSEMRAYMTRLITNEFLSRCRRSSSMRRAFESLAVEPLPVETGVEEARESEQHTIADVKEAIEGLAPGLRAPYVLYEFQGLSYNQIAAELRVTLTAVKIRIFRARQQLQQLLRSRRGGGGPS